MKKKREKKEKYDLEQDILSTTKQQGSATVCVCVVFVYSFVECFLRL